MGLRPKPPEQGRAESDSQKNLHDDQRKNAGELEQAKHREGRRDDDQCLYEEDRTRRHGLHFGYCSAFGRRPKPSLSGLASTICPPQMGSAAESFNGAFNIWMFAAGDSDKCLIESR